MKAIPGKDGMLSEVARWIEGMPIVVYLGITVDRLDPGVARLVMPYRRELSHADDGTFQASAVGALADFAAGAAAVTLLAPGGRVVTVDYTVKLIAPGRGELLAAEARALRPGRTLMAAAVDVYSAEHTGGGETLCASALVGLRAVLPTEPERSDLSRRAG